LKEAIHVKVTEEFFYREPSLTCHFYRVAAKFARRSKPLKRSSDSRNDALQKNLQIINGLVNNREFEALAWSLRRIATEPNVFLRSPCLLKSKSATGSSSEAKNAVHRPTQNKSGANWDGAWSKPNGTSGRATRFAT
jgi:hypothetical protein